MTEFLTENARRAYPLDGEWPADLRDRWSGVLLDACVYAAAELEDGERVALLSVQRVAGAGVRLVVGTQGGTNPVDLTVTAPTALGGFATVHAESAALKAVLTVDGRRVDEIAADAGHTADSVAVGVPLAMRCCGGATRRVTQLAFRGMNPGKTAQYGAAAPGDSAELAVQANGHAVLEAGDGVDLEVAGVAPLAGDVLRVSAIAAPEPTEETEDPIDLMIRGDGCFTVEAIPGAKVSGEDVVARTESDEGGVMGGGVVRIGTACKPCCDCEDYNDAVKLLLPANEDVGRLDDELDAVKLLYDAALARFEAAKAAAAAVVDSVDNVRATATAVCSGSGNIYSGATGVKGTRQRMSITLLVENMTTKTATVGVGADGENSGFSGLSGWTHLKTAWTKGGAAQAYGSAEPPNTRSISVALGPGETLAVVATYAVAGSTTNRATRPQGTVQAHYTVQLQPSATTHTRTVNVK